MKKIDKDIKSTASNTVMLYVLAFIKLILPLVTLPYLTRILSEETYGVVSYVKATMTYMQLIIDFGFIFSSVKDIVNAKGDKEKIGLISGHTYLAKTLLIGVSFIIMLIMCASIPILRQNIPYSLLSFAAVAMSAYMADFLFRGIEKMHIITIIFVIMRTISTVLTFVVIHDDGDVFLIPILDILSYIIAILISQIWIVKLGIKIRINSFKTSLFMLKDSFTYFLSSMATTVFSVLNTILIGIVITDLKQVAYWGVCMQIISAIQGLYSPIMNGIYPHMIRKKSLGFIHKLLCLFMPIVTLGCVACFIFSDFALLVIGGQDYVVATPIFRCLIPILFFSFPAQLYGWPTLGAAGLEKQTTASTIIAACVQVVGLVALIVANTMTLYTIAILKCFVEFVLMAIRMFITYKNRKKFTIVSEKIK